MDLPGLSFASLGAIKHCHSVLWGGGCKQHYYKVRSPGERA